MAEPSPTFGSILRNRRQDLNLSQQALADMLGVTQPTVTRWELDQTFPKPPELAPLANALEIPLETLLAPLESMTKERRQPLSNQVEEINERLDRLENNVSQILKLLRRRQPPS